MTWRGRRRAWGVKWILLVTESGGSTARFRQSGTAIICGREPRFSWVESIPREALTRHRDLHTLLGEDSCPTGLMNDEYDFLCATGWMSVISFIHSFISVGIVEAFDSGWSGPSGCR